MGEFSFNVPVGSIKKSYYTLLVMVPNAQREIPTSGVANAVGLLAFLIPMRHVREIC
jgi:hypothetical protein